MVHRYEAEYVMIRNLLLVVLVVVEHQRRKNIAKVVIAVSGAFSSTNY